MYGHGAAERHSVRYHAERGNERDSPTKDKN